MPGKIGNSPLLTHFGRGTNDCKNSVWRKADGLVIVK